MSGSPSSRPREASDRRRFRPQVEGCEIRDASMRLVSFINAVSLSVLAVAVTDAVADIPPHPEQIEFKPLQFEPPDPAEHRHTLSNGVVVFLAPSHEFPLVNVMFAFKGGAYLDPQDKIGLADATGEMIRRGGSAGKSAQDLDEEFDFLAADVDSSCGQTQSSASINALKSNFDAAFALFIDMLRQPRFQQDRLDVYKAEVLEALEQRNDDAAPILDREWRALLYGREHFEAAEPTQRSIQSITIDDLKAMHQRIFFPAPGHLFIAVTGDFEPASM